MNRKREPFTALEALIVLFVVMLVLFVIGAVSTVVGTSLAQMNAR